MNKEEKKNGFCRSCLPLYLCLLSASCAFGEEEYEQEVPMKVALTRTDGVAGSESTPLLLFWKETDFSTGTLGSPYKIFTLAGGIGDYADAPYNTEADYPADNSRVVAMGLCSSSMTMTDSHGTYSLPSSGARLTDVLVTPNGVTGSRKQPFGQALEFARATVRIVLKARRTDNTVGKLHVKNLKLTVPSRLVYGGVKWGTGVKRYVEAPASADLVIDHPGRILSTEDTQTVVFYPIPCATNDLLTDISSLTTPGLTLTADVARDVNFTTGTRKASLPVLNGNLNFMDQSGVPITQLQAGESYGTTLNFDIDFFTLEGEEKERGDGGKMTIPVIVPEPVSSTQMNGEQGMTNRGGAVNLNIPTLCSLCPL